MGASHCRSLVADQRVGITDRHSREVVGGWLLTANTSTREGPICQCHESLFAGRQMIDLAPGRKCSTECPALFVAASVGVGFYLGTTLFNSHYAVTISPIQAAA